jgi:hypothetical protein
MGWIHAPEARSGSQIKDSEFKKAEMHDATGKA